MSVPEHDYCDDDGDGDHDGDDGTDQEGDRDDGTDQEGDRDGD